MVSFPSLQSIIKPLTYVCTNFNLRESLKCNEENTVKPGPAPVRTTRESKEMSLSPLNKYLRKMKRIQ